MDKMKSFVSGWYVMYTRPRFEKKVVERLSLENIEFYLPTYFITRQWSDRRKVIETPLFPSYVFVYLQRLKDFYAGLSVEGVIQYVRFGKDIARVDDQVLDDLKMVTGAGKGLEMSMDTFKPSQQVIIKEGPLSGLVCEVIKCKNKEKILVRLNLLNRCVLVDLEVNQLQSV